MSCRIIGFTSHEGYLKLTFWKIHRDFVTWHSTLGVVCKNQGSLAMRRMSSIIEAASGNALASQLSPEILRQPSISVGPRETAFSHPSTRQDHETDLIGTRSGQPIVGFSSSAWAGMVQSHASSSVTSLWTATPEGYHRSKMRINKHLEITWASAIRSI
jgi:hypothetical protein